MSLNGSPWQYIIVLGGVKMILEIKGQTLKISNSLISEGALNYVTFEVKCDKSWRRLNKTVRFCHEDMSEIYDVADVKSGETYYLPEEVLKKGRVEVGVIGVKGGDTVVTTAKESFTVTASIDGGRTPRVSRDAYADYVNTVLQHTKKCKAAEKLILEVKEEVLRARAQSEIFYTGAKEALCESKEILENVSGALDAVGLALKDIREREEGLSSLNHILSDSERTRALAENERSFKEKCRDEREKERSDAERERELSEKGRITGERVRSMSESEREKTLRELDLRLNALEEKREHYTETLNFEECAETPEEVFSFSIEPKSSIRENTFTANINGEEVTIPLKSPLIRMGDLGDSIVFEKEKSYLSRRFYTLTLDGSEEIYEEDGEESIFVIPFPTEYTHDGAMGESSYFSYGKERKGERVWVSGNYLFLALGDTYTKKTLSEKLFNLNKGGTPLSVTFSLLVPTEEKLPFTYFDGNGITVTAKECNIYLSVKKNIILALSKLISKIEIIEKQLEKEN
ncbi:MAG: hypothetical protein IJ323_01075 [Clostridia bacterium]|nr:hypothetical protein [Clostridia bacterium]